MKKTNQNLNDEPITKNFFVDYMNDFSAKIARGFSDERNYMDKRFNSLDKRLELLEHDVAILKNDVAILKNDVAILKNKVIKIEKDVSELKINLKKLDKRTDEDDFALFSDIKKDNKRIAALEKDLKLLKMSH